MIKPLNGKKVKVAPGKETTLEVRYKGNPEVRWYIKGKQIPRSSKSRHFEFIKGGPGLDQIGPILKVKNFKKGLAGIYKVKINNAGCVNSKTIKVELDSRYPTLIIVTVEIEMSGRKCSLRVNRSKEEARTGDDVAPS